MSATTTQTEGSMSQEAGESVPHIYYVRKESGIAGQFAVSARVGYPDEPPRDITFVGSTYGGPVVMLTGGTHTFVTDPGRFGEFGTEWVKRFLVPRNG